MDDDKNPPSLDESVGKTPPKPLETGLGLATAARVIRLNYGQISMSSEGLGKGTNVCITLPYRKALQGNFTRRRFSSEVSLPTTPTDAQDSSNAIFIDSSRYEPSSALSSISTTLRSGMSPPSKSSPGSSLSRYPFPSTASRGNLNVLIAEDNPLKIRLLETRLQRKGHNVRVAVNGQACLDMFKGSPEAFDIILMDIQVRPLCFSIQSHIHMPAFLSKHRPGTSDGPAD